MQTKAEKFPQVLFLDRCIGSHEPLIAKIALKKGVFLPSKEYALPLFPRSTRFCPLNLTNLDTLLCNVSLLQAQLKLHSFCKFQ